MKLVYCRILLAVCVSTTAFADQPPYEATKIYTEASPSVVVVESATQSVKSQGSGISIANGVKQTPGTQGNTDSDYVRDSSWIVTNAHVIVNPKVILVSSSGQSHPAKLKYLDKAFDVAILFVEGVAIPKVDIHDKPLPIGSKVYAIGAPLGLERTITDGIVSSNRTMGSVPLIQTTAPISPGNSGGGLFADNGKLVGITTFQLKGGENLNFAIRSDFIQALQDSVLPAELMAITDGSLSLDEKFRLITWLASSRNDKGIPAYKIYSDTSKRYINEHRLDLLEGWDRFVLSKFREETKHAAQETKEVPKKVSTPSSVEVLECTVEGPEESRYLTLRIDFERSTMNNRSAVITDGQLTSGNILIDRYTGLLTLRSNHFTYQGHCKKAEDRKI